MLVLWPIHQVEHEHSQYPGIMNISAVLKEKGFRSEVISADETLILDRSASEDRVVLAYSTPSALATTYVKLNRKLKAKRPELFSVFGGAHPTYFPEMIKEEGVDKKKALMVFVSVKANTPCLTSLEPSTRGVHPGTWRTGGSRMAR